jgi:hypothetical protein
MYLNLIEILYMACFLRFCLTGEHLDSRSITQEMTFKKNDELVIQIASKGLL